jgi:hypothetical protein
MAWKLDDPEMHRLMNFYKCYRAVVRAKVQGIRKDEQDVPKGQREESRDRSRRYFQRALNYAVTGPHAVVMVVMGRIATGKTTLAHSLADELGWPVFSSDRIRKELAGLPASERPPTPVREWLYGEAMSGSTYDHLAVLASIRAGRGECVILDATFGTRQRRQELHSKLKEPECDVLFVEVQAPDHVLRERLRERETDDEVTSDARLEDFHKLTGSYVAPAELDDRTLIRVDGTRRLPEQLMAVYERMIEWNVGIRG